MEPVQSRQRVRREGKSGEELLLCRMAAAQERGELGPESDVRVLVRFVMTLDVGMATYDALGPKTADKRAVAALIDRVLV